MSIDPTKPERRASLGDRLIRLPNPDAPIFRIFPFWFFEEALRLRQLVLTRPSSWEDPFEVLDEAIAVNARKQGRFEQTIIQGLPPVFAQCWSTTSESDSLLRAYSRVIKDPHFGRNVCPRDEGVRVRSTPRKLLQALIRGTPANLKGDWFLGAVTYLTQNQLLQEIANAIGAHGHQVFEVPSNRAKLGLMKRDAFSHESEVRAIFVSAKGETGDATIQVPIQPADVFEDLTFDPRLESFERNERATVVKSLGYTGSITESGLYQRTFLEIGLPDDPEAKPSSAEQVVADSAGTE